MLNAREIEILKQIANRTWQYVAQDLKLDSYSRSQVFEFAVDADRLKTFCEDAEQKAAVLKFYKLDWKEQEKFAEVFFTFESYE